MISKKYGIFSIVTKKPNKQPQQQQPMHHQIVYKNMTELRSRFAFASGKRLATVWKFLRDYKFDYHSMISSSVST